MFTSRFYLIKVFAVLVVGSVAKLTLSADKSESLCNCDDNCLERRVIGLQRHESDETSGVLDEDTDADGNRTICARDRDSPDRTFPSVCHMLCYNKCTRYHKRKIPEGSKEVVFLQITRRRVLKCIDSAWATHAIRRPNKSKWREKKTILPELTSK